jgi:nicotinate-nucleotide adenylyltransferase
MRVAVYGGSFHPPHVGHAMVAAWLLWTDQVDEVWLVPVLEHAFSKDLAPFEERVRWCEALASSVGTGVRVCQVEAELPAPSYTIRTLEALQARHPSDCFQLVIGADAYESRAKWHRWSDLERDFGVIVVGRAGFAAIEGAVTFPEVSSTEVRRMLAASESVSHLVPAKVLEALAQSGLLNVGPDAS